MGVYEDMASDASYKYGTDENKQMARLIEEQQMREQQRSWKYKCGIGGFVMPPSVVVKRAKKNRSAA